MDIRNEPLELLFTFGVDLFKLKHSRRRFLRPRGALRRKLVVTGTTRPQATPTHTSFYCYTHTASHTLRWGEHQRPRFQKSHSKRQHAFSLMRENYFFLSFPFFQSHHCSPPRPRYHYYDTHFSRTVPGLVWKGLWWFAVCGLDNVFRKALPGKEERKYRHFPLRPGGQTVSPYKAVLCL